MVRLDRRGRRAPRRGMRDFSSARLCRHHAIHPRVERHDQGDTVDPALSARQGRQLRQLQCHGQAAAVRGGGA